MWRLFTIPSPDEDEITKVQLWERDEQRSKAMYSVVEEIYSSINFVKDLVRNQIVDLVGLNEDSMRKVETNLIGSIKESKTMMEKSIQSSINEMKQLIYTGLKQLDQRIALFDDSMEARFKTEVQLIKNDSKATLELFQAEIRKTIQQETVEFQKVINKAISDYQISIGKHDKQVNETLAGFPDMVTGLVRSGIRDYSKFINEQVSVLSTTLINHQKSTDQSFRELREQLALKMSQINKRLDETMSRFRSVASQLS